MIQKPLLAGKAPEDFDAITYPVVASPKLDGIRCLIVGGVAMSRQFKPIPNLHIQDRLRGLPDGLDGELLLPDWTAPFSDVSSAVMSVLGKPVFTYALFDAVSADPKEPYNERLKNLRWLVSDRGNDYPIQMVPVAACLDADDLRAVVELHASQGYEGTMIRTPRGPYKFGRSTTNEGILLKIKGFDDEEATVIGKVERMHNTNEARRNLVGKVERSTNKDGKVGMNTLGALSCVFDDGTEFEVGTGFTDQMRDEIWNADVVGRRVTVKHQPPPGGRPAGAAPRFPVFKGWRLD